MPGSPIFFIKEVYGDCPLGGFYFLLEADEERSAKAIGQARETYGIQVI